MLNRKARVGQEVNAYCGKCKLERTHVIAAMDGDTIAKVTCSTCGANHKFRQAPVAKAKKAASPRTGTSKSRKAAKEPVFSIDPKRPVKPYSMSGAFAAGDVINHPTFGLGSVELAISPNKIEVRFEEGKKLLLHNTRR